MMDVDEGGVEENMGKGKNTDILPPSANLVLSNVCVTCAVLGL